MKKVVSIIKNHKVITSTLVAFVLVLGIGGTAFALNNVDTDKAKSDALAKLDNGSLSENEIENIATGEEIVDPNTGETVVLTQDENGNVVRTVTKDAGGNSTGAIVPENHNTKSEVHSSPAAPGHTHNWVAHQATRQVQTGEKYVVDVPASTRQVRVGSIEVCSYCGQEITGSPHVHDGIMRSCGVVPKYETQTIPEQGHKEPIYKTETFVDYYYCSCGARQ